MKIKLLVLSVLSLIPALLKAQQVITPGFVDVGAIIMNNTAITNNSSIGGIPTSVFQGWAAGVIGQATINGMNQAQTAPLGENTIGAIGPSFSWNGITLGIGVTWNFVVGSNGNLWLNYTLTAQPLGQVTSQKDTGIKVSAVNGSTPSAAWFWTTGNYNSVSGSYYAFTYNRETGSWNGTTYTVNSTETTIYIFVPNGNEGGGGGLAY